MRLVVVEQVQVEAARDLVRAVLGTEVSLDATGPLTSVLTDGAIPAMAVGVCAAADGVAGDDFEAHCVDSQDVRRCGRRKALSRERAGGVYG